MLLVHSIHHKRGKTFFPYLFTLVLDRSFGHEGDQIHINVINFTSVPIYNITSESLRGVYFFVSEVFKVTERSPIRQWYTLLVNDLRSKTWTGGHDWGWFTFSGKTKTLRRRYVELDTKSPVKILYTYLLSRISSQPLLSCLLYQHNSFSGGTLTLNV